MVDKWVCWLNTCDRFKTSDNRIYNFCICTVDLETMWSLEFVRHHLRTSALKGLHFDLASILCSCPRPIIPLPPPPFSPLPSLLTSSLPFHRSPPFSPLPSLLFICRGGQVFHLDLTNPTYKKKKTTGMLVFTSVRWAIQRRAKQFKFIY